MFNAIQIQKAIKKIISRYILGINNLTENAIIGTNYIIVESTKKFHIGEHLCIRKPESRQAELVVVSAIDGNRRLILCENLTANWNVSDNCYVQKIIGYSSGNIEFLKAIYIGDPAVIAEYPAITIDIKNRSSEWFTLESTKETYEIAISVYVSGSANYDSNYELMHAYTSAVESALFRSFYPLVEPYFYSTLAEDALINSTTIRVTDEEFYRCAMGTVFLENIDHLRSNRIKEDLGNGVLRLNVPLTADFYTGDKIIAPRRHIFNMNPPSTSYGTINKGTQLKCSVISYSVNEEIRRYNPYIDGMTV